jgi:hypothetical protein
MPPAQFFFPILTLDYLPAGAQAIQVHQQAEIGLLKCDYPLAYTAFTGT